MTRYKKYGWFGESHRHGLASRGISTKKSYFSKRKTAEEGYFSKFMYEAKHGKQEEEDGCAVDYHALVDQNQTAKTDKYYAEKDPDNAFFPSHGMQGELTGIKQGDVAHMQQEVLSRLDRAISEGKLHKHAREDFLRDEWKPTATNYMNNVITSNEDFKEEASKKLDNFIRINSKNGRSMSEVMEGRG